MKKRLNVIGILLGMLLLAGCCGGNTQQMEPQCSSVHVALVEVDSLMWRQPDSAFALLQQFAASPEAGDLDTFNRHYCQLLISELLYKNDYAQSNRPALLQSVSYFDSLILLPPFKGVPEGRGIKKHTHPAGREIKENLPNQNDHFAFLDARAHYINGVGYYEKDSVVEACKEYFKALEIMENQFEEKDLVGKKAKFMTYTYNRLGDMFSGQFMMEPSIACYNNALSFYMKDPTSPTGVSGIYNMIGIQYDMIGQKDSAMLYYEKAIEALPNTYNLSYRNVVSSKTLLSYQMNHDVHSAIEDLNDIIGQTNDENERLARYLTIGDIYFEDGQFDSARYYLELVFEKNEDVYSKIQAGRLLNTIYNSLGEKEKSEIYIHYLANHNKPEAESKAFVSELNKLFQHYLDEKKEIKVEKDRKSAVLKVVKIIVPLAVMLALLIVVIAKLKRGMLLKKQQTEADRMLEEKERQHEKEMRQQQEDADKALEDKEKRHQEEMETERQTHKMQQAALSGRLKRSNEELRDVSKQLEQSLSSNALSESDIANDYVAFLNAPICQFIVGVVHEKQFKSKMDYLVYKDSALKKDQLLSLRDAAEKHLTRFVSQIRKQFPRLTESDMDYCYLFLLGLSEADVSALMQRAYTTVCDRSRKISRIIGTNDSLYHSLRNMLDK